MYTYYVSRAKKESIISIVCVGVVSVLIIMLHLKWKTSNFVEGGRFGWSSGLGSS